MGTNYIDIMIKSIGRRAKAAIEADGPYIGCYTGSRG